MTVEPRQNDSQPRFESSDASVCVSGYRFMKLRPSGIVVEDSKLYQEVFPNEIKSRIKGVQDAAERLYLKPLHTSLVNIEKELGVAANDATHARSVVGNVMTINTEAEDMESQWQMMWETIVYAPFLKEELRLRLMARQEWTTRLQPLSEGPRVFHAKSFSLPTIPAPDIAIGLPLETLPAEIPEFGYGHNGPFSKSWQLNLKVCGSALGWLKEHAKVRLHPLPAANNPLVYPCFVQEVESQLGSQGAAANKLAASLAFALDQQEELRLLAGVGEESRMPVFGAVSEGAKIEIWYAAYVGKFIQIVNSQLSFNLRLPSHACAFIDFMKALRHWIRYTYGPNIVAWLDALWTKTKKDLAAIAASRGNI